MPHHLFFIYLFLCGIIGVHPSNAPENPVMLVVACVVLVILLLLLFTLFITIITE